MNNLVSLSKPGQATLYPFITDYQVNQIIMSKLQMIKSTCNLLTQTNTISRSPPSLARHSPSSCPVSTSGPSGSRLSRSSRYYYIMNDSQISFITPYLSPGEAAPQHLPGALYVHGGAPELGHLLQVSDAH